jgi:hypothetical protein
VRRAEAEAITTCSPAAMKPSGVRCLDLLTASNVIRIFRVFIPGIWIVFDIFSNRRHLTIFSDHTLVVVALPQPTWKWRPSLVFHAPRIQIGRERFEPMHNLRQRQSSLVCRGNPLWLPFVYLWLPFVYLWLPLVYLWLPLVYLWLPLVYLWLPFVSDLDFACQTVVVFVRRGQRAATGDRPYRRIGAD